MSEVQSRITLKSIKYTAWASQDTHCFQAVIYLDGKRALNVENDGRGACNNYWNTKDQTTEEGREMLAECGKHAYEFLKSNRALTMEVDGETIDMSDMPDSELLDWLIADLVNEHLCLKEMKRCLKSKITFFDTERGDVYTFKSKPTPEAMSACKKRNSDKDHWVYLNDLSEQEAFKLWRKSSA